jgi:hypothetical protein
MIRNVPSGDLGLDVVLGGGWCLVDKLPERESATVLLRGGPGSGKTLFAVDVALSLATALKGDVVVACIELLPSEFVAQIEAGRGELLLQHRDGPRLSNPRLFTLPTENADVYVDLPRIFCGLVAELDIGAPDVVGALEALRDEVRSKGGNPVAFILDSLVSGYGLGVSTPRVHVDAIMKYAAQEGIGFVLCQETSDDTPSSWDFAVDTVIILSQRAEAGRELMVRKHRFGASAPGAHKLAINGWRMPSVGPRPDAWYAPRRYLEAFRSRDWHFINSHNSGEIEWASWIPPKTIEKSYGHQDKDPKMRAELAYVSAPTLNVARILTQGLTRSSRHKETNRDGQEEAEKDLWVEFESLGTSSDGWSSRSGDMQYLPILAGAHFAIVHLVNKIGDSLFKDEKFLQRYGRIIIGDFALLATLPEKNDWIEGVSALAQLVSGCGWDMPIVLYDSSGSAQNGLEALKLRADLLVSAHEKDRGEIRATITCRPTGTHEIVSWDFSHILWPEEFASLLRLPPRSHSRF